MPIDNIASRTPFVKMKNTSVNQHASTSPITSQNPIEKISLKSRGALLTLLFSQRTVFTVLEIQHLLQVGKSAAYAIIAALTSAGFLTYSAPCLGRKAFYTLSMKSRNLLSISSDLHSDLNKINGTSAKPETAPLNTSGLSENDVRVIQERATTYGLTPAFLLEKVAERRAAGKPFDLTILETTLQVAKERATKDFAGLFFTMFVKRDVFSSPYAENHTQPPRQPAQDATTPAARVNEPVEQTTPYKANASVPENLRPPVKTAEEQAAHYQQIAAPIPTESRLAIDVRVLTSGLMAMKASVLAGKQSAAQARACVTELLGGFAPEVWQAAEGTIQDVLRAFDVAVKPVQPGVPAKLASMARGIGARA